MKTTIGKVLLIAATLIICYYAVMSNLSDEPDVKVGQTWKYSNPNPFGEDQSYYIIEIRGEWVSYINVQYKEENNPAFYSSSKISWFTGSKTLVNENNP